MKEDGYILLEMINNVKYGTCAHQCVHNVWRVEDLSTVVCYIPIKYLIVILLSVDGNRNGG